MNLSITNRGKKHGNISFIGVIWLIYQFIKDASIKPVPPGTDYRQITIDNAHGIKGKELQRRIDSGYYVKKDKE